MLQNIDDVGFEFSSCSSSCYSLVTAKKSISVQNSDNTKDYLENKLPCFMEKDKNRFLI